MALSGQDLDFVNKANQLPYDIQAKLFLSAFWGDCDKDAVFDFCGKYYDMDLFLKGLSPVQRKQAGIDLDEHGFHVFLEKNIEPLTILEARKRLKAADLSFDGKVSYLEFIMWHMKKQTADFLRKAPRDLKQLEPQNLTPEIKAAQMALQAVMAEIGKIEDEKFRLKEIISSASGVKAMKAKNQLAQVCAMDMTDLNRALLTAEAAVRKAGGTGAKIDPAVLWWMEKELQVMKKYRPAGK